MVYNRIVLKLIPKPEPKSILPSPLPAPGAVPAKQEEPASEKGKLLTKADAKKKEEVPVAKLEPVAETDQPAPPPPREPVDFSFEVKNPDFLQQNDFIVHSDFADREGLLILIDPVAPASVNSTQMLSVADVIFVNEDGYITKIAPKLNLAELNEPVPSGGAVKAILFIKKGGAEQDRIVPGDHFENSLFKTHPVTMQ